VASASRIRSFQSLSSRTLELLCEEASVHRPAPLEQLYKLYADELFDRQSLILCQVPAWCPESELPF
jgi:hypothetical protein